ncbi:MAG: chromosome segregation protein SMC [Clostridia bacterium]|nr:chromosome segregation protein SMC [Clostridia bacterium]
MLLKRLELVGFKSFADKTVLDFAEGSCGVVGPNGSGKSNISDAIRWVIGETSAKSLRGSNMQDVIFAGTENRKGLNYAEVSLILDNSGHEFNVDYEEIKVTRRLFRSGESEYKINDAICRLKDVHELFMDTGLGRDGYSIIGQGSVSQILSTKAEDRRSLFEEAAGVSKYKYKKEEAARKLAKTDENLVRITDILTELEGQIGPLSRQSEKARKYLDIYGDMKQLDIDLSMIGLDRNREEMKAANKLFDDVSKELDDVQSRETENEQLISALYNESRQADEEKTEVNARLIENEARISSAKNDIVLFRNNIKNNAKLAERYSDEIAAINKSNADRTELIRLTEAENEKKRAEKEELDAKAEALRGEAAAMDAAMGETDEKLTQKREEIFKRETEISREQEHVSGIEALRAAHLERRNALEAEIENFTEDMKNTGDQLRETEDKISGIRKKLSGLTETVDGLNVSRSEAEQRLAALGTDISAKEVELSTKSSKKRMLEGLENEYAGYAKSVKAVLTAPELKRYALYGTVAGLTEVSKEYALAIETALGGALQNIITESEEDAKQAIAYLRRTSAGRATFLPISSVRGRTLDNLNAVSKCDGYLGIAAELIKFEKRYSGIFASLLGRVVVVDNIDNAIAMSRKFGYKFKVVTLAGDVLNAGGAMSGGAVTSRSGFLSRAAEIKSLGAEISALSRDIKGLNESRETAENDLKLAEGQLETFVPLVREYEDEILRLENTSGLLRETLDRSDRSGFEAELKELSKKLTETADEAAKIIAHISSLQSKNKVTEAEMEVIGETRAAQEEKRGGLMAEADAAAARIAELDRDIAVAESEIKAAYEEIAKSADEIESKRAEIEDAKKSSGELTERIYEKQNAAEEATALSEQIRKRLEDIDKRKADITARMEQQRTDGKDITDRIINLEKERTRADNKRMRLDNDYDLIINRLWDDYELGFESVREQAKPVEDLKTAGERLAELKKKIKSLGNVNMDAIEEYKAVKERFEFMTGQKDDLEASKKNLEKLISSMEELMLEHFGEQFSEINKAFSDVFRELFGGGRGRLYLSDPDNMLTSGVEIEVQLPGKGMQNLNLYSGGEKSFIAIALLFAILRVKPTPFCILDEIDAALDDVNVSRFATYLKNYTDRTQFIVITHRRGTMEAASVLYGVTMQESGVSKLLSLNIDEVADDMVE